MGMHGSSRCHLISWKTPLITWSFITMENLKLLKTLPGMGASCTKKIMPVIHGSVSPARELVPVSGIHAKITRVTNPIVRNYTLPHQHRLYLLVTAGCEIKQPITMAQLPIPGL